jgi:hypothetical protein
VLLLDVLRLDDERHPLLLLLREEDDAGQGSVRSGSFGSHFGCRVAM